MRSLVLVLAAGVVGFVAARLSAVSRAPVEAAKMVAGRVAKDSGGTQASDGASTPAASGTAKASAPISWDNLMDGIKLADFFGAARKFHAFLEGLTAEDFRRLREHPDEFAMPSESSFDKRFVDSFADAVVERWFAVDPDGAFEAIRHVAEERKRTNRSSEELLKALARANPEGILKQLSEAGSWDRSDATIPLAFTTLASRDANAARQYLSAIKDPEQKKAAELAIAQGVAKVDPLAALDLARAQENPQVFAAALESAERIGPGMLRRLLAANDGKFSVSNDMTRLMLKFPGEDLHEFLRSNSDDRPGGVPVDVMNRSKRLSAAQRNELLANLEQSHTTGADVVMHSVLYGWARQDPRAATEWAFAHSNSSEAAGVKKEHVGGVFFRWVGDDEKAAVAWWSQIPDSPVKVLLGNQIALRYARAGRAEEARAIYRVPADAESSEESFALASIAKATAERDPDEAAKWLDALPSGSGFEQASGGVLEHWLTRDPAAAARWVEGQPAGPRRDAAVSAYAKQAASLDPFAAGEWAAQVSDPKLQMSAIQMVYGEMKTRDPAATRAWLRSVPGLDPSWCERLIRYQ